jgi:D-alanyl-D-alanine carboxypeptidase
MRNIWWRMVMVMALGLAASAGAVMAGERGMAAALDAAVEREHAAGRFDGVVWVGRGDDVVFKRAIGWADRDRRLPHRVDELWRWASVSKQIAAVLAMQRVERGALRLDDTLASLLPGFGSPQARDITLKQLLQHTSGLPNPDDTAGPGAPADAWPAFYTARFANDAGPVDAALAFCAGKPVNLAGARFSYNNCDTLLLQAVLERHTAQPYAVLLQRAIAEPLQLTRLAFTLPSTVAAATADTPIGYLDAAQAERPFNLASFGAAGGLLGTAEELWRIDRALMQRRLLGDAAMRALWTGDPALGYVALGAWSFEAPLAGCAGPVALVERRGEIGGIQVRNLLAPELGGALIVFSNTAATEFGELWQGAGLGFELASAAFCAAPPAASAG